MWEIIFAKSYCNIQPNCIISVFIVYLFTETHVKETFTKRRFLKKGVPFCQSCWHVYRFLVLEEKLKMLGQ